MGEAGARLDARWGLAALAVVVFALGALVYLTDRDPAQVLLLPSGWAWHGGRGWWPALLRDSLPSFAHAFAFSVFSALAWARTRRGRLACCLAWAILDGLLECAQHPWARSAFAHFLPWWPSGRFDPQDVAALLAGAAVAAVLLWHLPCSVQGRKHNESEFNP